MRRFAFSFFIVLSAFGGTITVTDDARGWVTPNPPIPPGEAGTGDAPPNNGTAADNNYVAGGSLGGGMFRDWFEFAIPSLSGPILAATVSLEEPSLAAAKGIVPSNLGHGGPPTTYTLYGLPAIPTNFASFLPQDSYGSVTLDAASNGTTVGMPLDSAALQDIGSAAGGEFLLGGIDSGEIDFDVQGCNGCGQNFDFASTDGAQVTLTLVTADPAPEPSTAAACLCAAALCLAVRRHHTRAPASRPPHI